MNLKPAIGKTIRGVVRGQSIELESDCGIADGSPVQVTVRETRPVVPADGVRDGAGAAAATWSDEDDRILEEIYQARKIETQRTLPE